MRLGFFNFNGVTAGFNVGQVAGECIEFRHITVRILNICQEAFNISVIIIVLFGMALDQYGYVPVRCAG